MPKKNLRDFTQLKSTRDRDEKAIKALAAELSQLGIKTDDIVKLMDNALQKMDGLFGERYAAGGMHEINLEDEGNIAIWYGTLLRLESSLAQAKNHYEHYLREKEQFERAEARFASRPKKVVLVVGEDITPTIARFVEYAADEQSIKQGRVALDASLEALKLRDLSRYMQLVTEANSIGGREGLIGKLIERGRLAPAPEEVPVA